MSVTEWLDGPVDSVIGPSEEIVLKGTEALRGVLVGSIMDGYAWGKLFRSSLFRGIRFPVGRVYEDVRVIWEVVGRAELTLLLPDALMHYRMRRGSIAHAFSHKYILDCWEAYLWRCKRARERYPQLDAYASASCMKVACWAWRRYFYIPKANRLGMSETYGEISHFAREGFLTAIRGPLDLLNKLLLPFVCWQHPISFFIVNTIDRAYRIVTCQRNSRMFD